MSNTAQPPPDVDRWEAQYLRLIAFPVESQLRAEQEWWATVAGSETPSSLRRLDKRQDSGPFEGLQLSLEVDPLRIIWTVEPVVDAAGLIERVPTIGRLVDRSVWFGNLMNQWLAICPPIKRLAFADSLLLFVDSKDEGYGLLDRYLRSVDVDLESTDLMFRVNRRRRSTTGIPNLSINRLTTWTFVSISVTMGAVDTSGQTHQERFPDRWACLVELDINTVPDFPQPSLPQDKLSVLWNELISLGVECAARGEQRDA